eukprot:1196194-Prorocentrum_minimum.AAC.5
MARWPYAANVFDRVRLCRRDFPGLCDDSDRAERTAAQINDSPRPLTSGAPPPRQKRKLPVAKEPLGGARLREPAPRGRAFTRHGRRESQGWAVQRTRKAAKSKETAPSAQANGKAAGGSGAAKGVAKGKAVSPTVSGTSSDTKRKVRGAAL